MKNNIEVKTWRIRVYMLQKEIEKHKHFGWEYVAHSNGQGDGKITLTMKRDMELKKYKRIKKIEKQARMMEKRFPTSFAIWTLLATAFLLTYLFSKNNFFFLTFFACSLLFYTIAFFILLTFLILLPKKKSILATLYEEGDDLTGQNIRLPTAEHSLKPTEHSFKIRESIIEEISKSKNKDKNQEE